MKLTLVTILFFATGLTLLIAQTDTTTKQNWLNSFDMDGDGINDRIYFNFSGGAHCCYKLNVFLSRTKTEEKFPFEIDGGYVFGVDASQPEKFDIRDENKNSVPEIIMTMVTYNNIINDIPKPWKKKYKIKTNRVMIEYEKGKLKVTDKKEKIN